MWDIFLHLEELKKERNAVIFAHYYQVPDIQDVDDYMGYSPALSPQTMITNADIIFLRCSFYVLNSNNYKSSKIGYSLEIMTLEISIPDDIRIRVLKPLDRMMALS